MELSLLAANIRSLVRWTAFGLLGLFFLWLVWLGLSFSLKALFPPAPNQADEAFGKISKPFDLSVSNKNLRFRLQTPGGNFPDNPVYLPVYEIPSFEGSFSSLDQGNAIARNAGLDSSPLKLNEPIWRWVSTRNASRSLKLNIVTNSFVYTYDWIADPTSLAGTFQTTDEDLVKDAQSALTSFKSLKDDLKNTTTRVSYWNIQGNSRNRVSSLSDANAALVEFFRKKVNFESNDYSTVEPNSNLSLINVLLSPAKDAEKKVLEMNFIYWPINFDNYATYNIKTASQAYEDLKAGKAFVASGNANTFTQVSVTKIYLGYFNPPTETRFMQPVYILEGTGKSGNDTGTFTAYVPALLDDYFK